LFVVVLLVDVPDAGMLDPLPFDPLPLLVPPQPATAAPISASMITSKASEYVARICLELEFLVLMSGSTW
jgi:hypothetical protein